MRTFYDGKKNKRRKQITAEQFNNIESQTDGFKQNFHASALQFMHTRIHYTYMISRLLNCRWFRFLLLQSFYVDVRRGCCVLSGSFSSQCRSWNWEWTECLSNEKICRNECKSGTIHRKFKTKEELKIKCDTTSICEKQGEIAHILRIDIKFVDEFDSDTEVKSAQTHA